MTGRHAGASVAGPVAPEVLDRRSRHCCVDMIMSSLVAQGLTTGEVSAHSDESYGASLSLDPHGTGQ